MDNRFPRTLYKKDGPKVLMSAGVEYKYSEVLVEDESDFDVAVKEGYKDDFSIVMSDDIEETPKEEEESSIDFEDDDF